MEVEGRTYTLKKLDNVVIPAGLAHTARNASSSEPAVLHDGEGPHAAPDEAALSQMMRDPRYWRDRDPDVIAKVTEGFRRLYPA